MHHELLCVGKALDHAGHLRVRIGVFENFGHVIALDVEESHFQAHLCKELGHLRAHAARTYDPNLIAC